MLSSIAPKKRMEEREAVGASSTEEIRSDSIEFWLFNIFSKRRTEEMEVVRADSTERIR